MPLRLILGLWRRGRSSISNFLSSYRLPLKNSILQDRGNVAPTFSRSTTGTVIDFEGAMHTCKINEARFTGARRVENLLNNSENFNASYGFYTNTRCTIDSEDNEAPDGSSTASLCVQGAGQTNAGICNNTNIGTNPEQGNIRVSVHFKKGYSSWGALYTNSSWEAKTWFDVENGVVGTTGAEHSDATITDIGNGWHRCSVVVATAEIRRCGVYLAEGNHGTTAIAGTSSLYIWGYQVEHLSGTQTEASEYVSTGVSVATGEVVLDDDFNTDTTGDYSQIETTLSYEDSSFMRATYTTTNANKGFNRTLITTGKYYKIKFKAKGTRASVFSSIGNNVDLASQLVIKNPTLTASWQEYEFIIKATQEQCRFYLANTGSIGDVLDIDNISIKEEYYHGANVDGVKYFKTKRDGSSIEESTLKGYLNEPAGTNLITYSEDFNNADWNKIGTSITTNNIISVDGTLTGNKQLATTTGNCYTSQSESVVLGESYNQTVFAKKGNTNYISLTFGAIGFGIQQAIFDLDNGTVNTEINGTATITELYDGWYKCSFQATAILTTPSGSMVLTPSRSGAGRIQGVSGDYVYIWGAQLEASPFPTSYIKTEASTVTRTADSLTVDNTSRKVLPNSFCLAGTWSPLGAGADYAAANTRLFGSQDNRGTSYETRTIGSTTYGYAPYIGGSYWVYDDADLTQSTENKYAFSVFQDGSDVNAKIYKDGVQKLSEVETQTLDHSNESLEIGNWGGTVFASNIKEVNIYNKELPNYELAKITDVNYLLTENGDLLLTESGDNLINEKC